MSSTVGSLTNTGWKRRASAASFSMCLRVFVQRRGADAMQFAARQRRLQQVAGIHRAFGLSGADDGVQFVDEQNDAARLGLHFGEHGFQPLLELAAIFGAGDERAHVEGQQLLVLQAFGHVALDDAQRQAFGDRRFADAGLADEHGIVFRAAGQHLNGAADFFVAADDGIELAGSRRLGEVARIALQRIVGLFGGGAVGGASLADFVDGGVQLLALSRRRRAAPCRRPSPFRARGQQQPLGGDELVASLFGDLFGGIEQRAPLPPRCKPARRRPTLSAAWRAPSRVARSAALASPPAR